jgi:hypothetical protein
MRLLSSSWKGGFLPSADWGTGYLELPAAPKNSET